MADWIEYSAGLNGDVHFFDDARIVRVDDQVSVWTRVRYKTSVMGASSYQSLMKIDCTRRSEITIQSTFYSDALWTVPAMATNTRSKPEKTIEQGSATAVLADTICND